jgi:hypothetical protein
MFTICEFSVKGGEPKPSRSGQRLTKLKGGDREKEFVYEKNEVRKKLDNHKKLGKDKSM